MASKSKASPPYNLAGYPLDERTRAAVIDAELRGLTVVVRRLQLGDMRAPGFGEWQEVYRTKQKREEHAAT